MGVFGIQTHSRHGLDKGVVGKENVTDRCSTLPLKATELCLVLRPHLRSPQSSELKDNGMEHEGRRR